MQNNWKNILTDLPPEGVPILGYSPQWVHPDFNTKGVRECFTNGDGGFTSAKWCDSQDTYVNDEKTAPTHWQHLPEAPEVPGISLNVNLD